MCLKADLYLIPKTIYVNTAASIRSTDNFLYEILCGEFFREKQDRSWNKDSGYAVESSK